MNRALTAVLCVAFGALSISCAGGPTSDWPAHGDDDTDSPGPGSEEPPKSTLDAGAGSGFQDAGRVPTETANDGGDGGDAGVIDAGGDAGLTLSGPDGGADPGSAVDATHPADAARSDAGPSP